MHRYTSNRSDKKGWFFGPWNSQLPVSVGYASEGIDEPHAHERIAEIYLVAGGTALLRVGQETHEIRAGDVFVVEPGEGHTFLASSPDYFHFVVHIPGVQGEEAQRDKRSISYSELGLPTA